HALEAGCSDMDVEGLWQCEGDLPVRSVGERVRGLSVFGFGASQGQQNNKQAGRDSRHEERLKAAATENAVEGPPVTCDAMHQSRVLGGFQAVKLLRPEIAVQVRISQQFPSNPDLRLILRSSGTMKLQHGFCVRHTCRCFKSFRS